MIRADEVGPPWNFGRPPTSHRGLDQPGGLLSRVSSVPLPITADIEAEGLRPAPVQALEHLLVPAQAWIGEVPDLERLVLAVVRDIHSLASEPGYDVSHSQPRWHDRIFVSCPERTDCIGELRLAESVVHEAMHLHLTIEEHRLPLVATPSASAQSPWRGIERPVQGVLHGLFVFLCIFRFLHELARGGRLTEAGRQYVENRLRTIDEEIGSIDTAALSTSLTTHGQEAVASWLAAHHRTPGSGR